SPVHTIASRRVLHARAVEDARIRASDGRAPAGAVDRQDRGTLRTDVLVSLGSSRALAARAHRGGTAPATERCPRSPSLALFALSGVRATRRPGASVRGAACGRRCRADASRSVRCRERSRGDRRTGRPLRGECVTAAPSELPRNGRAAIRVGLDAFPPAARRALERLAAILGVTPGWLVGGVLR